MTVSLQLQRALPNEPLVPNEVHYTEKNLGMFSSKNLDILDDMGVSKLSAKVFFLFF